MSISYSISTEVLSLPNSYATRSGYQFTPEEEMWVIPDTSHTRYFNFQTLEPHCSDELVLTLKKALLWFLREKSTSHAHNMFCQFKYMVAATPKESPLEEISAAHVISYKGNLPPENKWYLGALSGFLKKWHQLGYPGIHPDTYAILHEFRIKGNRKGAAVLTHDPEFGPFDELELHAIHRAVNDAYATGKIGSRAYSLIWFFLATGARPVQVAALKIGDFGAVKMNGKVEEYYVNVPRAKQRNSKLRNLFTARGLCREIGEVMEVWIAQVKQTHAQEVTDDITPEELPIFPAWHAANTPGFEHHAEAVTLNREIQQVFEQMSVTSHRTGKQMRITPQRFRYTLATRMAMDGEGELVIAAGLDHTRTGDVKVYTKCVPEIIERLDLALAEELAPLADAFNGKIVERPTVIEPEDTANLVRYPKLDPKTGGIGKCGGCGECNGMVPIACYVCRHFQAWSDAPHAEVLRDLLDEQQRTLEETGDERIAYANENVVRAVAQVVVKCRELKEDK